jgi:hypothetical protein
MTDRCRPLIEEQLEQRTVLSAVSPVDPLVEADFNGDGEIGLSDLDTINCWVTSGMSYHAPMDLDQDGDLDRADVERMMGFLRTTYGDANYDGKFDSADVVQLFEHAQYDDGILHNSTWATGDFSGDREFDSEDLICIFQKSVYEPNADANRDGVVDVRDIDLVSCWIGASGGKSEWFNEQIDVHKDGMLDRKDVEEVIRILGTTYGDANLDGIFTSADLVQILEGGLFETGRKEATWQTGDFNGDQYATFDDIEFAMLNSVYGLDEAALDVAFASVV